MDEKTFALPKGDIARLRFVLGIDQQRGKESNSNDDNGGTASELLP